MRASRRADAADARPRRARACQPRPAAAFRRLLVPSIALMAAAPGSPARAAEDPADLAAERARVQASFPEAFAPVTDVPGLPRVLLIGDSISIGYTAPVRQLLAGVANVHRIPDNGGPTTRGLQLLDEWIGDRRWDVIHFNFGLHDIARVRDGQPRTPIDDYERNLRELVARLEATGARLVFATTTPVPDAETRPPRRNADAVACNDAARRVMGERGIPVDELYEFAEPRLAGIQLPANVHFTDAGYAALAGPVAASIRELLTDVSGSPRHPR